MGGRALPFVRPEKMNLLRSSKGDWRLADVGPLSARRIFATLGSFFRGIFVDPKLRAGARADPSRVPAFLLQSRRVRFALNLFRIPPVKTNVTFSTSVLGRIMMGIGGKLFFLDFGGTTIRSGNSS